MASAEAELPQAKIVVVVRAESVIVGVGAIKRLRPHYAAGISRKSGFPLDPKTLELGYIAVKESHRGQHLSDRIVAELLAGFPERPLFATTSNERMKAALRKAHFVRKGNEWLGKKNRLSLWVQET